jgi:hypothetical protein
MRDKYTPNNEQYFATLEGDEFVGALRYKIKEFYDDVENIGLKDLIIRNYRAYYGGDLSKNSPLFENAKIEKYGDSGQIMSLKLNHFRNLIKHTINLATAQKPSFTCRANNSDYKSQAQTILGNGLVDYYMREKSMTKALVQSAENALIQFEGWVHEPWNPDIGDEFEKGLDGKPIFNGDIEFSTHSLLDVVRDTSLGHDDSFSWLCVKTLKNKWDLVASHEDHREEILNTNIDQEEETRYYDYMNRSRSDDLVPVWFFYHEKTPALPNGRMVVMCGDAMLIDIPMPYSKIPLNRLTADKILNTPYGYTPACEALGGQEALNIITSAIMTNQGTHGVQNVWTRRGDKIDVTQLSSGSKHFQSDEMPKPIQLTATAPELFNFRQNIINELETLMGISSTVRGNPENNLKSGSALALVVSQSIQFASMLESSYNILLEEMATTLINHLRTFSKTPRIAKIVGNFNRPFIKEFNADDLSEINRVVVEQVSPLSKTISGRLELANNLLQQGFIENPKQYITVLTTGQLDPAIEGAQSELLNIRAENESLQNGEMVYVVMTENHAMHIKEHKSIIENPEAKKNPELVTNVTAHIQEHINVWRATDPAILMVTGQQPPPNVPQQNMPPPPQGENANPDVSSPELSLPGEEPGMPNMPNMPQGTPPEAEGAYEGAVAGGMGI